MSWFRRLIPMLLALTGMVSPSVASPALWKVSDANSSIYLFGSVHLFTREVAWRTPVFDQLLQSTDYVHFEVLLDVDAYATLTYLTLTEGTLPPGQTLRDMLSVRDAERLSAAVNHAGLNMASIERMRPWLATMTLTQGAYPKSSAGVEMIVDGEVTKQRKRGLETAAEQMGLFIDVPVDEQIAGLMATVQGIESGALAELGPLVDAWESGDTEALASVLDSLVTPEDHAAYARLIDNRNANWIGPLEELLQEDKSSLVIVGAAHLVGPSGVPALLQTEGYSVERIDGAPFSVARVSPR